MLLRSYAARHLYDCDAAFILSLHHDAVMNMNEAVMNIHEAVMNQVVAFICSTSSV